MNDKHLKRPGLRRRIYLTYRYLGWRTLLFRAIAFPLRVTPLGRYLKPAGRGIENDYRRAVAWYREHGEPVSIVIPSYRDAERVAELVASIRATVPAGMARIFVADDASGPENVAVLRAIAGIEVIAGEENAGFAANVNRGLRAALAADEPTGAGRSAGAGESEGAGAKNMGGRDVVVLNSDMVARPGWLAGLQYASRQEDDIGIVGARLLYPDGRIQFAGTVRNVGAPEWFDHRYRFKP
ncbi:MAG: glycosyltransferase family 2 protein, partial [Solirubrobacterales bacterium]